MAESVSVQRRKKQRQRPDVTSLVAAPSVSAGCFVTQRQQLQTHALRPVALQRGAAQPVLRAAGLIRQDTSAIQTQQQAG
ncbi:hypothetical protein GCM10008955_26730 [Deinococcus malanensis]|uniref:Uncharacterized protein n=1 Tax=Deinococcus malanensis TaxID=1706855 RepID=A0ABQ2EXU3_9DEIO|nr:hypothetical protein [Deinococcus malanensis]GGK31547.1 hypothetical protein GCM10008955_26730 [Deinococcus malanensis]